MDSTTLEEGKTCLEQLVSGNQRNGRRKLKENKSPSADGISPKLLQEIVDKMSVFNLSIQEHGLALVKGHCRVNRRKYTLSQRVVNYWNRLPEECINANSVNMFYR